MINTGILPSYRQGFARSAAQAANPHAWKGLKGYWDPSLAYNLIRLADQVSGVDATPTNMLAADRVPGPDGRVWDLPDVNDVLTTSAHSIYNDISQMTWIIRVRTDATADHATLVAKGRHGANVPFIFYINNALTETPAARVSDGVDNIIATGSNDSHLIDNTWYDIAWTFMASSELRLFLNGVEDTNSPFASPLVDTLANAGVGDSVVRFGLPQDGLWPLDGKLGRIAYYNRLLTQNEIIDHWVNPHLVTQLAI